MRTVALSGPKGNGLVALVDDQDFDLVAGRWSFNNGYASRHVGGRRNSTTVLMHRLILGLMTGDPTEVDHINGDRLDNRRGNLRVATSSQNKWNAGGHGDRASRFKGVRYDKRRSRWAATIMRGYEARWLGYYDTEEEAASAYDAAARDLHGTFARPNGA